MRAFTIAVVLLAVMGWARAYTLWGQVRIETSPCTATADDRIIIETTRFGEVFIHVVAKGPQP